MNVGRKTPHDLSLLCPLQHRPSPGLSCSDLFIINVSSECDI